MSSSENSKVHQEKINPNKQKRNPRLQPNIPHLIIPNADDQPILPKKQQTPNTPTRRPLPIVPTAPKISTPQPPYTATETYYKLGVPEPPCLKHRRSVSTPNINVVKAEHSRQNSETLPNGELWKTSQGVVNVPAVPKKNIHLVAPGSPPDRHKILNPGSPAIPPKNMLHCLAPGSPVVPPKNKLNTVAVWSPSVPRKMLKSTAPISPLIPPKNMLNYVVPSVQSPSPGSPVVPPKNAVSPLAPESLASRCPVPVPRSPAGIRMVPPLPKQNTPQPPDSPAFCFSEVDHEYLHPEHFKSTETVNSLGLDDDDEYFTGDVDIQSKFRLMESESDYDSYNVNRLCSGVFKQSRRGDSKYSKLRDIKPFQCR